MEMTMPHVVEQHHKFRSLAGKWVGEETINPTPWDPKGGTAVGRVESRVGLGGFFLISEYAQERDGKVCYEGHGVYGWDAKEQCYTMHWFDSMSGGNCSAPAAKGTWEGNTLTFQNQSEMGYGRYSYLFEGDGRYTFRMDQSQDGKQWVNFMEGKYTRK